MWTVSLTTRLTPFKPLTARVTGREAHVSSIGKKLRAAF